MFIRGAESNHTLVLVDGVRINPGTIGLPPLQNIPPDIIERIEIIKGPRSALWGTDAIGGVINVITRRGSRDGWSTEIGYGSYDTRKANVNGGFGVGDNAGIDFGVSWLDSDGFPTRTRDSVPGHTARRSRLRQPEREPGRARQGRFGGTLAAALAHAGHVRIRGFLRDARRPGFRIVDHLGGSGVPGGRPPRMRT